MTPEQLAAAVQCKPALAATWAPHINSAMDRWKINTPARQAMFLATIGEESMRLTKIVESTNYTRADRLLAIFPHDFADESDAAKYVKNPQACANRIYANQNGNGTESSGDGWRYRGRGLIQITGRANYQACSIALFGYPTKLLNQPETLEQYPYAAMSAGWFWQTHGCNELADLKNFQAITKKINGGLNGYKARLALLDSATHALETAA